MMLLALAIQVAMVAIPAFSSLGGASFLHRSFAFAVSRNNRRQRNTGKNAIPTWNLHADYSADESISNAYKALSNSKQIVAFRVHNRTMLAYAQTTSTNEPLLQESLGCKPLHTLLPNDAIDADQHFVLITGIAGDCRSAVRYLKQVALNHTFDFITPPSGEYLANKLGAYLQEQRGSRPLAVHAFVISTFRGMEKKCRGMGNTSIFEVSATGSVNSVHGGTIGGPHMQKARQFLEGNYKDNLTEEEGKELLSKLFDPQYGSAEDSDITPVAAPSLSYKYIVL